MRNLIIMMLVMAITVPSLYADSETDALREELRAMKVEMQALKTRIGANEKSTRLMEVQALRLEDQVLSDMERRHGFAQFKGGAGLTLSGNIDIVAFNLDSEAPRPTPSSPPPPVNGDQDTSDIILDQVRLQLDADINENVSATIVLLYEDYGSAGGQGYAGVGAGDTDTGGDDQLSVDEAYITVSSSIFGVANTATIGRQYMPFGDYTTNFINDTGPQQLGETRDTGITVSKELNDNTLFNVFWFNGLAEDGGADTLDAYGFSLSFDNGEEEGGAMSFGVGYINTIFAAQNANAVAGFDAGHVAVKDKTPGYVVNAAIDVGSLTITTEYMTALEDVDDVDTLGTLISGDVRPTAWNVEMAADVNEWRIAVKYEQNNDQNRGGVGGSGVNGTHHVYGLAASKEIYTNTTLSLNYEYWDLENDMGVLSGSAGGGIMEHYLVELSVAF